MDSEQFPSVALIAFANPGAAERRIAGVVAAARIVRELAEAGFARVWLGVDDGAVLAPAVLHDVQRLAGSLEVRVGEPPAGEAPATFPGDLLIPAAAIPDFVAGRQPAGTIDLAGPGASLEVLRRTGKGSDGPVSRWLNRPISRRISALLLRMPWMGPMHATAGTVVLAVLMFAGFVAGGPVGLIAGGLLFQAASVFDGVDGEVARATFRTSRMGATLDSLVDVGTNALMIVGLTVNLSLAGQERAALLGGWGLALFVVGQGLIGWRTVRMNAPVGFDLLKHHYRVRMTGPLRAALMRFLTVVSSRDFFALLFMVLILAGVPMAVLYIFAGAATIWMGFLLVSLLAPIEPRLAADLG